MKKLLALKLFLFLLLPGGMAQTKKGEIQSGRASFYADAFHGRRTASGERFDKRAMTAAHRWLPFGTVVKVTNPANGKSVYVRINDRGPHRRNRIIDLSRAAAQKIGIKGGAQPVILQTMHPGKASPAERPDTISISMLADEPTSLDAGQSYLPNGKACRPKGYGLQVASYYSPTSALYDAASLRKAGIKDVYVQVPCAEANGAEQHYRVVVGQYKSQAHALAQKAALAKMGYASFLQAHL